MSKGVIEMKLSKVLILLTLIISTSKPAFSQGEIEDQYRQMGGIVGLTELCFGTKDLETALFQQVGSVFYNSPTMGRVLFELLYLYFESYEVAKIDQVVWNGSQQAYSATPFDCSEENKNLIRSFEEQLIVGLSQ